ncbi:Mitochondrial carrier protein [Rutstroemia sp. NJR-2017a WRK4]|nr:Mitochondrial carrier protein [Rutstroemia sp. NJR-2017a WRK4]
MRRAVRAAVIAIVLFLNVVVAFLYLRNVFSIFDLLGAPIDGYIPRPLAEGQDRAVVIGHLEEEDISWVGEYLPDWQSYIYSVDNPNADLHTINKGHESIVYLTYIIDNYDDLPSTIAFLHAHQYGWWDAWHTDVPGHDNVVSLNTLNLDLVQEQGYVNLRCASKPGCQPQDTKDHIHINEELWGQIFGEDVAMPEEIGAACCAQFAVSRAQVEQRSKEEYIHFRNWVVNTTLPDRESGRVMEYLWHIIFGRDGVHCPDPDQCYCEVYGRC